MYFLSDSKLIINRNANSFVLNMAAAVILQKHSSVLQSNMMWRMSVSISYCSGNWSQFRSSAIETQCSIKLYDSYSRNCARAQIARLLVNLASDVFK